MLTFKVNVTKFNNALLLVVFYFLLFACFSLVIKDYWEYKKIGLVCQLNHLKLILSLCVLLMNIFLITTLQLKDFIYAVGVVILIFFVFPSSILYSHFSKADFRIFLFQNILFWSILFIGKLKIKLKTRKFIPGQSGIFLLCIVVAGLLPFLVLYLPYLNFKNFLFVDIYETRALMSENVNTFYTNYTYSWFNKFIIPCLLVFGLYYRNITTVIIASCALLFLFLCGAHKAVFIGFFVVLLLYKFNYLTKINYLIKLLICLAILSLAAFYALESDFLMLTSIRRPIILPSFLDILYFDFFDKNYMYWSESIGSIFIEYPYPYEHSYVIGERYFGLLEFGANNGIISDGFMNFGVIGMTINILIVSLYFSVVSQLNISSKFFGLFFVFIFLLVSSSLTTILLTHGGVILLILSFYFMRDTHTQMDGE